jgi:hypothetical protein
MNKSKKVLILLSALSALAIGLFASSAIGQQILCGSVRP